MSNVTELTAAVSAALEDPARAGLRTFPLEVAGRAYWVKQAIGNDPTGVRLWQKLGFSGPFNLKPQPLAPRERLQLEGRRLEELGAANFSSFFQDQYVLKSVNDAKYTKVRLAVQRPSRVIA